MPDIVIGVDAGGSKTLALAAGLDGQILARASSGPANYQVIGSSAAFAALRDAIESAADQAAAPGDPIHLRGLCLGLAGVDRHADRALLEAWARETFPGIPVLLVNDARILLSAGTPDGWGLAVISGTGSIAYGRDPSGRQARAGGWGYWLGDEGSGYAIGAAALRAVTRAQDGRAPQTALTAAILAHWNLTDPTGLVRKVYGENLPRAEIARLARLVETTADADDATAQAILSDAGRELALAAAAVAGQLGLADPIPCALAGGVLVQGQRVRAAFLEAVSQHGLALAPLALVEEPARGAVRLALQTLRK